ncbi:hypothetical protein EV401DRAFT_1892857 [Pisolithus croceorrhizus]|nr:hypothetical protein EV401DRAFT_1892857 [Pisolithus croceorrhizus]
MPPVRSQCPRSESIPPLPYLRPEALQPLPLLSSQMEMVYQQVFHIVVVAEQEMSAMKTQLPLGEGERLPRAKSPHSNQTPGSSAALSPQSPKAVSFTSTSALPEKERLLSLSPSDSSLSSLESLRLESKIPKPPGKVGQPGRGGYNLEEHLKWTYNEMYKLKMNKSKVETMNFTFKVFTHEFNMQISRNAQSQGLHWLWKLLEATKIKAEDAGSRSNKLSQGVKDRVASAALHRWSRDAQMGDIHNTERVNWIECGKKKIGELMLRNTRDVRLLGNKRVLQGIQIEQPETLWVLA